MNAVIFYTREQIKAETDERKIVAMGLNNWANCFAGNRPPEDFGEGMVIIGERLGIIATPENVYAFSEKFAKK